MKYIFIVVFIMVYLLFGLELGYTKTSPTYTHLTYMFQHTGLIHLTMNSVAFIVIFYNLQKILNSGIIVITILICGFGASFLSMYNIPTVGASSLVYSMIGIDLGMTWMCKQIKITNTQRYLLFIGSIVFCLTVSIFRHNSNFLVHIYSLILGFIFSIPFSLYKNRNLNV